MADKRLIIVDGYSLLYRAFFATRYLSTSDGKPTNALYGFCNMLFILFEREHPDAVVVALDAPGKTFRHHYFAEYKATRSETADELKAQLPWARDLIAALGIPSIEVTGFEADDVVGTISRLAEEEGYATLIITGDNDALQLVDESVRVVTPKVGVTDVQVMDVAAVIEKYSVPPASLPDWKAIVGDKSDNIPGVPGIGEKGAAELLALFGSIENLLEHYDDVPPKYQKKIDPVKDQVLDYKFLATIKRDVELDYDFDPLVLTPEQFESAREMLEMFEFRSLARRVHKILGPYVKGEMATSDVVEQKLDIELVDTRSRAELFEAVGDRPYGIYFEPVSEQLGFFDEPTMVAYVAVGDGKVFKTTQELAQGLFREKTGQAVAHDAKPIYKRVATDGRSVRFDTMLAGFVLQSGRTQYALRDLIQGYTDLGAPQRSEEVAASLLVLERAMRERLGKEEQTSVLEEIELPLVPILAEMEGAGIMVDPQYLGDFSKSLEGEIERLQTRVWELAGQEFNIGSPKQLGEVLFEKLGIPGVKKTKTGYATGAEVLNMLAPTHEIATEILNWRELTKLKSTYSDSLPKMVADDGRIHTSFTQTGAATGRLSSSNPNLQNIPIRTELGRKIRSAFIAPSGWRLASFDYSQIELRLLAHLCRDEKLVDAFQRRIDVHTVTASLMFQIPEADVTKEQRRYAKMLNYAVLYGVTDFGLANQLGGGFSVREAKGLIENYYARFPAVKEFTESVVKDARSKGFTTTLCGRRRYFPDIHAANRNDRMYAERQAINAPIQGAAADMIKIAMIRVRKTLGASSTRMLLQVHDELLFETPADAEALVEPIRQQMEEALPLSVPVEVDAKVGANWNDMTPVPAGT